MFGKFLLIDANFTESMQKRMSQKGDRACSDIRIFYSLIGVQTNAQTLQFEPVDLPESWNGTARSHLGHCYGSRRWRVGHNGRWRNKFAGG